VAIVATLFVKCNNLSIPKPAFTSQTNPEKFRHPKSEIPAKTQKKKKHANAGLGSHQLQQRPVLYSVYGFRLNPKSARKLGLHRGELFIVVSAPR
jgi:hypothetical protein